MAWDLAINLTTGDFVWTGVGDLGSRGGDDLDKQRIHVRLFIERGEFIYDPTGGALGSSLLDVTRIPRSRALNEIPLLVREALAPMPDIDIIDVRVTEQTDPRKVLVEISYKPMFDAGEDFTVEDTLQENLVIEIPT